MNSVGTGINRLFPQPARSSINVMGALGVRCCHSLEFGQDRHFLEVLSAEARPIDTRRCGAGALDADRVGWRRDHTERLIGWIAGHGGDDLQIVHGRGNRHRRVTELAQDGEFQVAVAFAFATTPPIARDRDGAADNGVEPGMAARATSSDQRSPRDKLAASSILSGGIRRGSSFLKPPRNLGVCTKTVMPRLSAWARSGRCGESGLTLIAAALFQGSMSRSRAAATSEPAKFGIPAVRRKRKARQALSTKPVPDPLSRGALVGEVPSHDRKWSSASW
jgi:hypothetical protein